MKRYVAFLLLGTIACAAVAHQDRVLKLSSDDAISELPPPYDGTRLHIDFQAAGASKLAAISLSVPGHETRVRPCLLAQIPPSSKESVQLSGSWDHDLSIMPPYLLVRIWPANANMQLEHGEVELLFSLRDATLMSAQQDVMVDQRTMQSHALDAACR